jgi:septal ring factor EnvC (AmiA/AmiB activator)
LPILLVGQDQNALEKKRKKLENEINQTQKAIQQTQQTRDNSLKEIVNLEKQIQLRKELIDNTTKEVKGFSGQIQDIYSELKVLETNLEQLRQNYGLAIYGTFKSYRMADQLMFIASSNSFSDALRRLNYLRKIGDYRKTQVDEIVNTQTNINAKLALIQDKKNKQESLLSQQKNQEHALTKNKSQKALLVDQLKVKESKLNVELDKKRKEAEKLNAQIQAIIAKEIERQRKLEEERKRKEAEAIAAAAKEKAKTPSSTTTKETKTTLQLLKHQFIHPLLK